MTPAVWSSLGFVCIALALAVALSDAQTLPGWQQLVIFALVIAAATFMMYADRVERRRLGEHDE